MRSKVASHIEPERYASKLSSEVLLSQGGLAENNKNQKESLFSIKNIFRQKTRKNILILMMQMDGKNIRSSLQEIHCQIVLEEGYLRRKLEFGSKN